MTQVDYRGRVGPIADVTVILVLFIVVRSLAAMVKFPFPGPIAIVISVGAIWGLLRLRGNSFINLGFSWPKSILNTIAFNLVTVVAVAVVFLLVLEPMLNYMGIEQRSSGAFEYLAGNQWALILTLVCIAWGTAAFGEEIVARGFLLNRLTEAMGGSQKAVLIAIFLQAVLFGLAHFSYGLRGIIATVVVGILLGTVYLVAGRNLWAVIPAHGIVATISMVQTYSSNT